MSVTTLPRMKVHGRGSEGKLNEIDNALEEVKEDRQDDKILMSDNSTDVVEGRVRQAGADT